MIQRSDPNVDHHCLENPYVHQWLDVCDTENAWLEAQCLNISENQVQIHYKGGIFDSMKTMKE